MRKWELVVPVWMHYTFACPHGVLGDEETPSTGVR